jgi:hypothetical protein
MKLILNSGDFFKYWLQCKMEVRKISNNPYSIKILESMEIRQKQLFDNDAVRAALYLDPRFNFAGSSILQPSDVELAQVRYDNNKSYQFFLHNISLLGRNMSENQKYGKMTPIGSEWLDLFSG